MDPLAFSFNQLKVFATVYRAKSMTTAARELHLTQSGVSQHIQQLEASLEVKLFDRVSRRLVPTANGNLLFAACDKIFSELKSTLGQISQSGAAISGIVRIGMPVEFGNNVVVPLLSKFALLHNGVSFDLRYGLGPEMGPLLLSGDLDFAFVDAFRIDRRLKTQSVYNEVLHLCAPSSLIKKKEKADDREFLEGLPYVDYQLGAPVAEMWHKHHLGSLRRALNVRAWGLDAQGVARLIVEDAGAGVLPGHLVERLRQRGAKLHIFRERAAPLQNKISIAYLEDKSHELAVRLAREHLLSSLG